MENIKVNIKSSTLSKAKAIVQGAANLIQNSNKDISKDRMDICKGCPLLKFTNGVHICDPSKKIKAEINWLNNSKDNADVSVNGCNCILENKTTVVGLGQTCPALKWNLTDLLYLAISNKDYVYLQNTSNLDKFIESIKTIGLVMSCYNFNVSLVKKLISHQQLVNVGYEFKVLSDGEPVIEYHKNDRSVILLAYINGAYSLSVNNSILVSREQSLTYNINELLNTVLNPTGNKDKED